jgi:hypothetical protein
MLSIHLRLDLPSGLFPSTHCYSENVIGAGKLNPGPLDLLPGTLTARSQKLSIYSFIREKTATSSLHVLLQCVRSSFLWSLHFFCFQNAREQNSQGKV